jgi:hypothetical protein
MARTSNQADWRHREPCPRCGSRAFSHACRDTISIADRLRWVAAAEPVWRELVLNAADRIEYLEIELAELRRKGLANASRACAIGAAPVEQAVNPQCVEAVNSQSRGEE